MNNLKQLSLAMHLYQGANQRLPGLADYSTDSTESYGYSAQAQILPYVEQGNVAVASNGVNILDNLGNSPLFNMAFSANGTGVLMSTMDAMAATPVKIFQCAYDAQPPIHTGENVFVDTAKTTKAGLAGINYVLNTGTGQNPGYIDPLTGTTVCDGDIRFPTDGMFWYGSRVQMTDVRDGASNTLMFAECLMGTDTTNPDPGGLPRRQMANFSTTGAGGLPSRTPRSLTASPPIPGSTNPLSHIPGYAQPLSTPRVPPNPVTLGNGWNGERGSSWIWGNAHTSTFNTYLLPNDGLPDVLAHCNGYFAARSWFPGGVNVSMCDGSVHFISNTIDYATWQALSTRAGSDTVGAY